jgi:hypothetical protein
MWEAVIRELVHRFIVSFFQNLSFSSAIQLCIGSIIQRTGEGILYTYDFGNPYQYDYFFIQSGEMIGELKQVAEFRETIIMSGDWSSSSGGN